jgi:hypothetical protein
MLGHRTPAFRRVPRRGFHPLLAFGQFTPEDILGTKRGRQVPQIGQSGRCFVVILRVSP